MDVPDLSAQQLLRNVLVDVVGQGDGHAHDQWEHTVEVAALSVMPLEPLQLLCGDPGLLPQRFKRGCILCNSKGNGTPMMKREKFRAELRRCIFDVIVFL